MITTYIYACIFIYVYISYVYIRIYIYKYIATTAPACKPCDTEYLKGVT